jgi:hypothetical protein
MNEHEEAFVRAFIRPERRDRYLHLLGHPKRRQKALNRLSHRLDLDWKLATRVSAQDQCRATLERLLRREGAGNVCHVLCDSGDVDGRDMPLAEAIDWALSHPFGVVLCCVPGRLALYKEESIGGLYLLRRSFV